MNHNNVPSPTPATHESLPCQSGVTQSRELKYAAKKNQPSNTPGLASTRTKPIVKAEVGLSRSSRSPIRSSILCAASPSSTGPETDLAIRNFIPSTSMNPKVNNSIAGFMYLPVNINEASPVKAIKQ